MSTTKRKNANHYCAQCGEKIQVYVHPKKNPRQAPRNRGRSRWIPGHDLCRKCFLALCAKQQERRDKPSNFT